MYPFQFLSTVHDKVANSNPTNYIFLRSAINTLSYKSPFFQNLKIGLERLPLATNKRSRLENRPLVSFALFLVIFECRFLTVFK